MWVSDLYELVSSELQVNYCFVCVNSHLLDSQSHKGCLQQVKPEEHVHCLILSAFQAGQMAVSLAVQMGQMKKMLNLSGKPSFTPTVVRGATSNSMRCSRFSLSQSFALRLCFTEANPTTTLLLMRTATATSAPSCYLTKASLACKAPAQILEVITTPNLLADADRHCLLVRCLSAPNHAPIAHQCRCATAGAPR